MEVNYLIDEWMNENHRFYIKENTLLRYRCSIDNHIKSFFNRIDILDVTPRLIQHFIFELKERESERTHRKLSNSTINNVIAILKLFFKYCVDYEFIDKNPMNNVKNFHIDKYKENKAFSKIEQKRFETYIEKSNDLANFIYIFALYTGLRIGEMIPLTWKDVNLRTGIVNVDKNISTIKNNNNNWVEKLGTPKSKNSIRVVPLPRFLITHLKAIKQKYLSKYVFVNNEGIRLTRRNIVNNYAKILKCLRIKYISFHSLRHTFATRALETNIDIKTISEVLGHANAAMTLNIYSHSLPDHKRLQMRKMKRII